jgi:hypothetical protein
MHSSTLVHAILAGVGGLCFGTQLLLGDMAAKVTLFYQRVHIEDTQSYPYNVQEMANLDLAFTQVLLSLVAGLAVLLVHIVLKRIARPTEKHRREAIILTLVALGFGLHTIGLYIIGWDVPHWQTFQMISFLVIAPGAGLTTWGCFILFMESMIRTKQGNGVKERLLLGLMASMPSLFLLTFYPNVHGSRDFYLAYRTLATFCLPLLIMLVAVTGMAIFDYSTPSPTPQVTSDIPSSKRQRNIVIRPGPYWISLVAFLSARGVFGAVFFGSVILFPNYIRHVDGMDAGLSYVQNATLPTQSSEDSMVLSCVLLMAGGSLLSRILIVLATDFPLLFGKKNLSLAPKHVGWAFGVRFIATIVSVITASLWYVMARSPQDITSPDFTSQLQALAFFIGYANGGLFFDAFISVLFYFNRNVLTDLDATVAPETRLGVLILSLAVPVACMRYATGFFGAGDSVDYRHLTMILLVLACVSAGLEMVVLMVKPELCGRLTDAFDLLDTNKGGDTSSDDEAE